MTKAKKTLSLALAIVMVLSILAFNSFAASETANLTVTADKTSDVKANDNVTFTVKITNNYFLGVASVPIKYDAAIFDFVSYSVPETIFTKAGTTLKEIKNTAGLATISIFPDTATKGGLAQKFTSATTLLTITLKAKTDITVDTTVAVDTTLQRSMANPKGELFLASISGADVTDDSLVINDLGQTITAIDATISGGGSATPNTLTLKAGYESVIVDKYAPEFFASDTETTGVIYGVDTIGYNNGFNMIALADVLTTTLGDANLVITASNEGEGIESTGTKVEVLAADKATVLETYYFVYFGDINGDGYIDNVDATSVATFALESGSLTDVASILSGDANGDTYADNADTTEIKTMALNDAGYPDQGALATLFYETISPDYGI